jgi:hypothetical protein
MHGMQYATVLWQPAGRPVWYLRFLKNCLGFAVLPRGRLMSTHVR